MLILRALILKPDQVESKYTAMLQQLVTYGAPKLNQAAYTWHKSYMDANNGGNLPDNYFYPDIDDQMK